MPSYAIVVPGALDVPGPITDTGATQPALTRGFSFNGSVGDEVEIYASVDGFVSDVVFVVALAGAAFEGGQVLRDTIARYYRAIRVSLADPPGPLPTCFLADISGTPGPPGPPGGGVTLERHVATADGQLVFVLVAAPTPAALTVEVQGLGLDPALVLAAGNVVTLDASYADGIRVGFVLVFMW